MKRFVKYILRIVALALALVLAFAAYPYVRNFVVRTLGDIDYDRSAQVITHEMEKLGELTALRLSDTGVMDAKVDALLVGTVASVRVEYRYDIGFGVDLTAAVVTGGEEGITVALPPVKMLYDSFEVTNSPEIRDFFALVTEKKYQEMLSEQALSCREKYVDDADTAHEAWEAACDALRALFKQWTGNSPACRFVEITE